MAKLTHRNREEVLNVALALCLDDRGIPADPESIIQRQGKKMLDVIFLFNGLRCTIEAKISDNPRSKEEVFEQARSRVEIGIAHLAVAIIYPESFRSTAPSELKEAMDSSNFDFMVYSENGPRDWHKGRIDDILGELSNAYESLVRDDAVTRAVGILSDSIKSFSTFLRDSPATCERLMEILGITRRGVNNNEEDPE